jgi:hypothetical protein
MGDHILYRGIKAKHKDDDFTPSAMRPDCVAYMEDELKNTFNCDFTKLPKFSLQSSIYSNAAPNAPYNFCISLLNCYFGIKTNRLMFNSCLSQLKHIDIREWLPKIVDSVFNDDHSEKSNKIGQLQTISLSDFVPKNVIGFIPKRMSAFLIYLMHDLCFFQHINYVFSKLYSGKTFIPYPTMCLDWTWNKEIAKKFAGKDGTVVSISFEKYKKMAGEYGNQILIEPTNDGNCKGAIYQKLAYGLETYRDTINWDDTKKGGSWDNALMIEQEGAGIFWPWVYKIEQLRKNDFGKDLGFVVVCSG